MTEFPEERGEMLNNLVLLEDHGFKQSLMCPYCAEKHISKILGYAEEIAAGGEDVEAMRQLASDFQALKGKIIPKLKADPTTEEFNILGQTARNWRRQLQGAGEHKHSQQPHTHDCYAECLATGKKEHYCMKKCGGKPDGEQTN